MARARRDRCRADAGVVALQRSRLARAIDDHGAAAFVTHVCAGGLRVFLSEEEIEVRLALAALVEDEKRRTRMRRLETFAGGHQRGGEGFHISDELARTRFRCTADDVEALGTHADPRAVFGRSEERRVGKEWRSRGAG